MARDTLALAIAGIPLLRQDTCREEPSRDFEFEKLAAVEAGDLPAALEGNHRVPTAKQSPQTAPSRVAGEVRPNQESDFLPWRISTNEPVLYAFEGV